MGNFEERFCQTRFLSDKMGAYHSSFAGAAHLDTPTEHLQASSSWRATYNRASWNRASWNRSSWNRASWNSRTSWGATWREDDCCPCCPVGEECPEFTPECLMFFP